MHIKLDFTTTKFHFTLVQTYVQHNNMIVATLTRLLQNTNYYTDGKICHRSINMRNNPTE